MPPAVSAAVRGHGPPPAWGMLTGVRPVRLVHDMRRAGKAQEEIESFFRDKYFADGEKYKLAVRTADNQAPVLALNTPRSYSLYISIPFCPSRCSYCSFVSRTTAESGSLIEPYVQALCRELAEISSAGAAATGCGWRPSTSAAVRRRRFRPRSCAR